MVGSAGNVCEEALRAYLAKPVNFGSDTHAQRVAESDAFRTGFVAGMNWYAEKLEERGVFK